MFAVRNVGSKHKN